MDKLSQYSQIARDVLTTIAKRPYSTPTLVHEAVFDTENDHYLVLTEGWEGGIRRIHHYLVHPDIRDGKIWIQRDGTEAGVAYDLEAAETPKSDIVLAFYMERVRPHTGYAVT